MVHPASLYFTANARPSRCGAPPLAVPRPQWHEHAIDRDVHSFRSPQDLLSGPKLVFEGSALHPHLSQSGIGWRSKLFEDGLPSETAESYLY